VAAGARGSPLFRPNDLADVYMDALQDARRMQRLFFATGTVVPASVEFDIPLVETAPQTTFYFNVDTPAANLTVELRDPANNLVTPPTATIYTTVKHAVYHLNVPLTPGTWHARLNVAVGTQYIAGVLARDPSGADLLLAFSQVPNGGLTGQPVEGRFERGRPVTILATLTDSLGRIRNAQVEAEITKPDGSTNCGTLVLTDEGRANDGQPDDGVYGAIFYETWQGSAEGVDNDTVPAPPPGTRGSYRVRVTASGISNHPAAFSRVRNGAFQVYLSPRDRDQDGLPDPWEVQYGTEVFTNDVMNDPDGDMLSNAAEFQEGTDPRDPDTDGGGELDGSEVAAGRCPLDPADDQLPPPLDVEVVQDLGDEDEGESLIPGFNLLRFPWHPTYLQMRVYRAVDAPVGLVLYRTLSPAEADQGNYYDEEIVPGHVYYYQFQAVGGGGSLTRRSTIVSATAGVKPGDFDADGDVDLGDHANFHACMFGPEVLPAPPLPLTPALCLAAFDFEPDGDVDLEDFKPVQDAFTGP